MNNELLQKIREKGLLLEKDIFEGILSLEDSGLAVKLLETLEKSSGRMITKSVLKNQNTFVQSFVRTLGDKDKETVEKVFVKLGISLEVSREREVITKKEETKPTISSALKYKIDYSSSGTDKKLAVADFVGNFRARYQKMQSILMTRPELQTNLVSINKISNDRQSISFIGMLSEKRVTKNKNLILTFEDLTGKITALVKVDKKELFESASELLLDDIVGVKCSGNREIVYVHEIFYPDSFNLLPTQFNEDISVAFISDIHCGNKRHLGESFLRFIEWLNSEDVDAKKIRYIFIVGDTIDGVGVFPNQEDLLELKSIKEQYVLLASYLNKFPKHITMFLCPGQHDAVRVAEPQPVIGKAYGAPLYEIPNLVLVSNPSSIKLLEGDKEFKVIMYHGASITDIINEIKELRETKSILNPAKAIKHILKRRHLSPTHSLNPYIPNTESDPLIINEVPDVICTGDLHRSDVGNYHGTIILTCSCWQSQTPFEESIGHFPDPEKVPVLNLKTREIKVFDFKRKEETI